MKRYEIIKNLLDFMLALTLLVFLLPLFIIISICIKYDSKGPILFKQKRIGKNKKLFYIWKFRTMQQTTPSDMPTHLLDHAEQYITKIGKFLRKSSLDELPQIFNIIKGEMSFIGPRPALWNQQDLIEQRDAVGANQIKPGLTGLAQVNGRDELEIPIKAQYDGEYVKKMSFAMDFKILWLTIKNVVTGKDIIEGKQGLKERKA